MDCGGGEGLGEGKGCGEVFWGFGGVECGEAGLLEGEEAGVGGGGGSLEESEGFGRVAGLGEEEAEVLVVCDEVVGRGGVCFEEVAGLLVVGEGGGWVADGYGDVGETLVGGGAVERNGGEAEGVLVTLLGACGVTEVGEVGVPL